VVALNDTILLDTNYTYSCFVRLCFFGQKRPSTVVHQYLHNSRDF